VAAVVDCQQYGFLRFDGSIQVSWGALTPTEFWRDGTGDGGRGTIDGPAYPVSEPIPVMSFSTVTCRTTLTHNSVLIPARLSFRNLRSVSRRVSWWEADCSMCREARTLMASKNARERTCTYDPTPSCSGTSRRGSAPRFLWPLAGLSYSWEGADRTCVSIVAGAFDVPTGLEGGDHIFTADKSDYYEDLRRSSADTRSRKALELPAGVDSFVTAPGHN